MVRHRLARHLSWILVLLAAGCNHIFREKVTPYPSTAPRSAPWRLNREFLLPEQTSRILFVVDHKSGREPSSLALDHLAGIASRYGERPATWVRAGAAGAPRFEFDKSDELQCPAGPLDPSVSYVFIQYLGASSPGLLGRTILLDANPACGRHDIYSIQISQDTLARQHMLWLTREKLEEYDLVHEYGHVLGLGSNPAHGYFPYYPDMASGDHCVNPECALAGPHPKALIYRAYRTGLTFRYNGDYCTACRRDIEQSKRHWRTGEVFPPAPPAPERNLSKWIAELKDEDFQEGGRALYLLYHDKEVMPALMKRMYTLPTDGSDSPRAVADRIARVIVTQEARKRLGRGFRAQWAMGDLSREMQWWWMKEGSRFMAGEDWELPEAVNLVLDSAPSE